MRQQIFVKKHQKIVLDIEGVRNGPGSPEQCFDLYAASYNTNIILLM